MKNNIILILSLLSGMAISSSVLAESQFAITQIGNKTQEGNLRGDELILNVTPGIPHHIEPGHTFSDPINLTLKPESNSLSKKINSQTINIGTRHVPMMFTLKVSTETDGQGNGETVINRVQLYKRSRTSGAELEAYHWDNKLVGDDVKKDYKYKINLNFMKANGDITPIQSTSIVLQEQLGQ